MFWAICPNSIHFSWIANAALTFGSRGQMHQSMKKHCNASHHFSWTPCLENKIAQASQETYSKQVVLIGPLFEICVPSLLTNILLGAPHILFAFPGLPACRVPRGLGLAINLNQPRRKNERSPLENAKTDKLDDDSVCNTPSTAKQKHIVTKHFQKISF